MRKCILLAEIYKKPKQKSPRGFFLASSPETTDFEVDIHSLVNAAEKPQFYDNEASQTGIFKYD